MNKQSQAVNFRLIFTLTLALFLAACGNKGDLYLTVEDDIAKGLEEIERSLEELDAAGLPVDENPETAVEAASTDPQPENKKKTEQSNQ